MRKLLIAAAVVVSSMAFTCESAEARGGRRILKGAGRVVVAPFRIFRRGKARGCKLFRGGARRGAGCSGGSAGCR